MMGIRRLSAALLTGILFLGGCGSAQPHLPVQGGAPEPAPTVTPAPAGGADTDRTPVSYRYKTDVSQALEYLVTERAPAYLLLANKHHPLGVNYRPDRVVTLTCSTYLGKEISLEERAAYALYAMLAEMAADGVTDIMVASGYRDYRYQVSLFNQYLNNERASLSADAYAYFGKDYIQSVYLDHGKTGLSRADAERVVRSYSAYPGTSEHQTGLCVDLLTSDSRLDRGFADTPACRWLVENCYRFGFILRYPEGKTDWTGYAWEPWHYRFVGREAATEIWQRGICLEEYLE